jgi:alcohol dehydrogenase class IV
MNIEMMLELSIPTNITFGVNSLDKLLPPSGPLLFVASSSVPGVVVDGLISRLHAAGSEVFNLTKPPGEPMSADIELAYSSLPFNPVSVVGVGGGSVLDFAKALALLAGSGGKITDYEYGQRAIVRVLPLFLAPTTCGSGSEVTPYTVVNNSVSGRKFTLNHQALRPVQAAIDPIFLRHLPPEVRLVTALDAFIHCLEARLSRADRRLIYPFADAGLALGWRFLPQAGDKKPTNETLEALAQMSLYGGLSIAHSRTGLIHTLSVAFAAICDLPHGLLNAYMLPHALAHNLAGYRGLLAESISLCSQQRVTDDMEALDRLVSWLRGLVEIKSPAPAADILSAQQALVQRVLQDSGLPSVSHGDISEAAINGLIRSIANAT